MAALARRRAPLLALLTAAALAVGCGRSPATGPQASRPPDRVTIALGHGLDYLGVDPFGPGRENTVLETAIYEPLLFETPDGKLEPALAESWEAADGGKTWTFHLRRGVTFHDGSPFDARAVRFAFDHYRQDPALGRTLGIAAVETPDDHTVVFRLERPFAPFLTVIGSFQTVIPSPSSYDASGNFVRPVGTGPFKVAEHRRDLVRLVRNENHWRGAPRLAEIVVKYIPDPATMVLALESGEVDLIGADGYGVPRNEVDRLRGDARFKVRVNRDRSALEWVAFNLRRPVLSDVRVRQALNYALDRRELAERVLGGYAVPAKGPIGFDDTIPWTDTSIQGYPYDPDKARSLLAEAGWKDTDGDGVLDREGRPLRLTFLFDGAARDWKLVAEAVQQQLARVGVQLDLQSRDQATIADLVRRGDFDLAAQASIGKRLSDPFAYIQYYFTSGGRGTVIRGNETLDRLYGEVVGSLDTARRREAYRRIQEEIMRVVPGAFLYHPARVAVLRADVQGWEFAGTMDPLRLAYKLYREQPGR